VDALLEGLPKYTPLPPLPHCTLLDASFSVLGQLPVSIQPSHLRDYPIPQTWKVRPRELRPLAPVTGLVRGRWDSSTSLSGSLAHSLEVSLSLAFPDLSTYLLLGLTMIMYLILRMLLADLDRISSSHDSLLLRQRIAAKLPRAML
jgi:hypothetical protein